MSFSDDLNKFGETCLFRTRDAFTTSAELCLESIQMGSPITAAPGQPVDTGVLRASWQLSFPDETTAQISTNVSYAPFIEEGMNDKGSFKLRSTVGGFHSVKMTIAGFYRIVAFANRAIQK